MKFFTIYNFVYRKGDNKMTEKQEVKLNNLRNEIAYWYELLVLHKNYPYTKKAYSILFKVS